ncbi:hypothetical protein H7F50_15350 [Novosphingobium flavum]|uniref:Uncharacterized protein n=1 Tax=Novosphingobium aerophilum TaxID=2839843 RepID=A0A7X1KD63_9SPHN|nr:hypothetical protein [Novosphingobium aerophilum]MBC2652968.1 hypothetical protein [Novosphingobium aerophilum]MBC2663128.1 hypothetical protein [Novosphingobium aerophilum]
MIAAPLLAAAIVAPDPAPLRSALERCDKGAIAALTAIEPKRRAAFSGAVYDEQRAIAEERARLDAAPAAPDGAAVVTQPGAVAAPDRLRAALDARQRRLDDARTVERAWRESLEDGRAAFLAQCTNRRDGGQP